MLLVGGPGEPGRGDARFGRGTRDRRCLPLDRPVSKRQTARYLETATVLVSPRTDGTNTPLKIYEQLASGRPFVATRVLSHTQVLNEQVCFLVEPEPSAFAAGLLQALNDPDQSGRRSAAARQLYEIAYSRARYEEKMRCFLETLR